MPLLREVVFSPEETAVPVRVLIPDDDIVEPTETFHVSTYSTQATVFVLDNDGQLCVCVCVCMCVCVCVCVCMYIYRCNIMLDSWCMYLDIL